MSYGIVGKESAIAILAEMAIWLSSPNASFVTGTYFAVDGGYLAQ